MQVKYYKFLPGESAYAFNLNTLYPCKIYTAYTSDKYNHSASPHRRYVVVYPSGKLGDIDEGSLVSVPEFRELTEDYEIMEM